MVSTRRDRYEDKTYPQQHNRTPVKAKTQAMLDGIADGIVTTFKARVFRAYNVAPRTGYRHWHDRDPRRLHDSTVRKETRGAKKTLTPRDIRAMEIMIQTEGFEARSLNWKQLGEACGLDQSGRTIARAMGSMGYRKCIACCKGWVTQRTAAARLQFARDMLAKYPNPEDWRRVRFSDECHWGFGPEGKYRIIRKLGQRLCPECIQLRGVEKEEHRNKQHCWAAVGYNFKSNLIYYDVPGNRNGKLSHKVYVDTILDGEVKRWLAVSKDFVLEEDGDSGHGYGGKKDNIVKKWKRDHSLETYQNCHDSPDLSIIENIWQIPKQVVRRHAHWDDTTMRELINEGWEQVTIEHINKLVDTMPQRLRDVIKMKGQLTGW
ncbi:uncharacterized protein EAE98_000548 [Botrytis deweyae]|uniref:Tc1-like transposase DDE domain-containing protein n=1 Tax=Botrytis deweyae TaxID=2478750 RepID=A0ABQ7IZI3_9HELO|nr:uncharacterized protein EAE98_010936 [Botrytis deweyae]XP_038805778.1 uncharacterized protein EAE98_010145 [Botrytis deweyae]XP_038806182.1 uncharacterized protein EAE98_009853 [Botrytis deweyae]XP_038808334.1 uncharacterized protein EAE98_007533 [Botrytis deweyae]XP_038813857.1 uncharacterized protein EAE98_002498 [Botrytis deweyae]XP_038814630.1 uncharacterized protein EAE98_000746 [Botrytis deweyae]XP_038815378.1 uncharacterized protein EAE98_000083 [Botrytis deweyae]XP_038815843.1 unc